MADSDGGVYGRGFEIVDTTYGPGTGRLIGYRTHQPNAFEVRFNGELLYASPALSTAPTGPHSRACSIFEHAHGPHCSTNCPTCHGRH